MSDPGRAAANRTEVRARDVAAADTCPPSTWLITFRPAIPPIPTRPLWALEQALFGETSPLYDGAGAEEQKAVLLSAEAEAKRDPGLFSIFVRVRQPEDLPIVRAGSSRLWPRRPRFRSTRPD